MRVGVVDHHVHHFARLEAAGVTLRNPVVSGPGGSQALIADPSGNLVELFQPKGR